MEDAVTSFGREYISFSWSDDRTSRTAKKWDDQGLNTEAKIQINLPIKKII